VPGGSGGSALDPKSEYALSGEDEGWTATHRDPNSKAPAAAAPGDEPAAAAVAAKKDAAIPDLADLDLADEATVSASSAPAATTTTTTTTIATRTYDLSVTYDQYYRVPRMWLVGYDEAGAPLKPEQVLEDVSEDHARKTITVEPHPHGGASAGVQAASIHPCRHAEVMKRLAERAAEGGGGGGKGGKGAAPPLTVDRYLVLFLKFIASVVPTIQYDYTMET
jgi:ubiquitin-like-conjugating enzyme ATG3